MDKHYYLIAQLPMLKFGEQVNLTKSSFLEEAKKWLTDQGLTQLKAAEMDDLERWGKIPCLKKYKKFELTLRKELILYRERKKKKEEYQRGEVLSRGLLDGNPLEVEKKLYFYRWQKVDQLFQDDIFNLEAVIAYFLKLQILKKLFEFDKEKGISEFDLLSGVTDEKIR